MSTSPLHTPRHRTTLFLLFNVAYIGAMAATYHVERMPEYDAYLKSIFVANNVCTVYTDCDVPIHHIMALVLLPIANLFLFYFTRNYAGRIPLLVWNYRHRVRAWLETIVFGAMAAVLVIDLLGSPRIFLPYMIVPHALFFYVLLSLRSLTIVKRTNTTPPV